MAKTPTSPRRVHPVATLLVKPGTTHLSRLEGLLVEIRHEQDVTLKRLRKLEDTVYAMSDRLLELRAARVR